MLRKVGRAQLVGIAAILALFFAAEFAMNGFNVPPRQQAQAR
jgi:hypothetical protein